MELLDLTFASRASGKRVANVKSAPLVPRAGRSIGDCRGQFQPVVRQKGYALARLGEHREGGVRRLFDHLKERAGGTAWRALALLPIAHRLDRHADPGGESGLGEPGASAHIARIARLLGARGMV